MAKNVEKMVNAVKTEFDKYPAEKFLFFYSSKCRSILMDVKGYENLKVQHRRKRGFTGEQSIQFNLDCKKNIFKDAETLYEQHR